jgi:phenylpyruvate tautomerase PptA (4-oxalocrotonate tautomerase family)
MTLSLRAGGLACHATAKVTPRAATEALAELVDTITHATAKRIDGGRDG